MPVTVQILPVSEMAIPLTSVYNHVGPYSKMLDTIQGKTTVEWSDGTVSEGVKHCGNAILIDDNGTKILVDTGIGDLKKINNIKEKRGDRFYLRSLEPLDSQLDKLGVKKECIDIVVNTHLHWDHIGGNLMYQNAMFIFPEDDLPYLLEAPPYASHFYKDLSDCVTKMKRPKPVKGNGWISEHVRFMQFGGHSPGSLVLFVETKIGTVAIAADTICRYENWKTKWIGPSGNFWNMSELERAYDVIAKEADIIIPGHDWKVLDYYPNGIVV